MYPDTVYRETFNEHLFKIVSFDSVTPRTPQRDHPKPPTPKIGRNRRKFASGQSPRTRFTPENTRSFTALSFDDMSKSAELENDHD